MKYQVVLIDEHSFFLENVESVDHNEAGTVGFFGKDNVLLFETSLSQLRYVLRVSA